MKRKSIEIMVISLFLLFILTSPLINGLNSVNESSSIITEDTITGSSATWSISSQTDWEGATDNYNNTQIDNDRLKLGDTYSLDFDGTNDYVGLPVIDKKTYSQSIWFMSTIDATNQADYSKIISGHDGSNANTFIQMDADGTIKGGFHDGSSYQEVDSGITPSQNQWYHIVVTYDETDLKIYIDNTSEGTISPATTPVDSTGLNIGRNPADKQYIEGEIDDARIYSSALSSSQITDLYNKRYREDVDQTNIEGHWKMNEGSGSTAGDSSGNNNDGTINGATWTNIGYFGSGTWTSTIWDDGLTEDSEIDSFTTEVPSLPSGSSTDFRLGVDTDGSGSVNEWSNWKGLSSGTNSYSSGDFSLSVSSKYIVEYNLTAGSTPEVGSYQLDVSEGNLPPEITNPSPSDGATGISTNPTLSVDVADPEGDSMNVTFYNASDDLVIGENTGVSNGTTSVTWSSADYYNYTYNWYVVAEDSDGNVNTSDTWSFTTEVGSFSTDPYTWDGFTGISDGEEVLVDSTPYDLTIDVDSIPDRSGADTIINNSVELYLDGSFVQEKNYSLSGSAMSYTYSGLSEQTYTLKAEWHYELGLIETEQISIDIKIPEFVSRALEQGGVGSIGGNISTDAGTLNYSYDFNTDKFTQVDIYGWYDSTGGSSYPEYDQPLTRFHIQYDGSSWSLLSNHPNDEVMISSSSEKTANITVSEQLRYTHNSGSAGGSGTSETWNVQWEAQFNGYETTITKAEYDEFGVNSYISISVDVNSMSASGEPGQEVLFDQSPTLTYIHNSQIEVLTSPNTWLEDSSGNEIELNNIYVNSSDMGSWENWSHSLDSEVDLLSGIKDAPTEGNETSITLDWKITIPVGTPANQFTADIEYKINKTNPGGYKTEVVGMTLNEEEEKSSIIGGGEIPIQTLVLSVILALIFITYCRRKQGDGTK